ncbi:MAG TPA: NADH-quinone oxidoreductase subunit J [Vicinamibacterales bacterium]|nr:NADH-quinone oxidoreductase subunit J [Vicinamibacterales bacterium]HPW21629.1 NADH-quinone oxidoreductase subunit J [Vicinamibacterales bacterium]
MLLFLLAAAVAVAASLAVVLGRNPMHSVLLLIVSFAALAALYIGLDAPFAAVVQIIIYAGAIMVLFLFVVMLLNAHREDEGTGGAALGGRPLAAGAALAIVLAAELAWAVLRTRRAGGSWMGAGPESDGTALQSVRTLGGVLYSEYSLAFEVTSLLIIVAMVGAVVLARRES